jgi:hypothetical protein
MFNWKFCRIRTKPAGDIVSWRLWHALNHPPAQHPLFWRTLRHVPPDVSADGLGLMDRLSLMYLVFVTALIFIAGAINLSANTTVLTLLVVLLALPIFAPVAAALRSTLFSGMIYGILWADQISQCLSRERENHTYELLSLLPPGVLAPSWAICVGCLYRSRRFQRMLEQRTAMMRIIVSCSSLFILLVAASAGDWLKWTLLLGVAVAALHIDLVHSLVLSALIGLLIPHYSYSRIDVRLWTIGGFFFVQIAAYTLALLAGLVVAPKLLAPLALPPWLLDTGHILTGIAALYAARECLIAALWRWLLSMDNVTTHDLDSIFRFAA